MDVPALIAVGFSVVAAICSAIALYIAIATRKQLKNLQPPVTDHKNEHYAEIANMLSDGAMVWQQLMVQCDESSSLISSSMVQGNTRDNIGDWLLQLRQFCRESKSEIDRAYQVFALEAKNMSSDEIEMQRPDIEKFHKEMKSNVAVISNQVEHIRKILRGTETVAVNQFKITLHKPQVMPHFLRKRQKMAELQRRRAAPKALKEAPSQ